MRDRFRSGDVETPELDARLLAETAFGLDPLELSSSEKSEAPSEALARLDTMAERRLAGEPVARILGHKEFYGLDFVLNEATLVPRPETEQLVELGLKAIVGLDAPQILDLGTGSGCIAIALLVNAPKARAVATDLSPEALDAARENAERHGVIDRLELRTGSWCGPLALTEAFDLAVSNPPYVETEIIGQLPPEVSEHDPALALDGGEDGLSAYRSIADTIAGHLKPGGTLLVEVGSEQGLEVGALLSSAGFASIDIRKDLGDLDRVVVAHQIAG